VIKAPRTVEAQVLAEPDAADHLVPWHPLLRDIEPETHRRSLCEPVAEAHGQPHHGFVPIPSKV
jgi:hypothetical protein